MWQFPHPVRKGSGQEPAPSEAEECAPARSPYVVGPRRTNEVADTSASGAEDDSPPFQRWVGVPLESESPGDDTGWSPEGETNVAQGGSPGYAHFIGDRAP